MKVQPGEDANHIIRATLQILANLPFNFIPPHHSLKRVIFWYQLLSFGNTATIILKTTERQAGETAASLTGAVRTLVDSYKLRVIVDSAPNSLDDSIFTTQRDTVIDIKPMTKEVIWDLPQLQDFFEVISKFDHLGDFMWNVLGDIPARYERMSRKFFLLRLTEDPIKDKELIGDMLCNEVYIAVKLTREPNMAGFKELR